jgi:hypothetical protein
MRYTCLQPFRAALAAVVEEVVASLLRFPRGRMGVQSASLYAQMECAIDRMEAQNLTRLLNF